ncbi:MAG: hypothetical protein M1818_004776 [Claussenomyces sp. TS43310]|nr:MAG: hypothetical protein M1818_004776 [Claussenomyces sp. TS43310]
MPFVTETLSLETMDARNPRVSGLIASRRIFTARNPKSLEIYSSSPHYFPGNNTRTLLHSLPYPIVWSSGASCYLKSVNGGSYLDFCGEYTSGICGHDHPLITASIIGTCRNGFNFGGINTQEKKLAQIVCDRFMLDAVRFTNTGTEANMMALALATNYTRRRKVLVFSNGYHGSTINFPVPAPPKSVNLPHGFVIAPFNDISGTERVLSLVACRSLAAILVEAVQGAGGAVGASLEFLRYLREAATAHKALFIADEVMTFRLAY